MCATESRNVTGGFEYFRGLNEQPFSLGDRSDMGSLVNKMGKDITWNFFNGTTATGKVGRFDRYTGGGTFYIQANDKSTVGKQRTILRSCAGGNLYELYLYIEIKNNNYPDFKTELETSYLLTVGKVHEYKLPQVEDKEGNEVEVYIEPVKDKEYPKFLFFDNITNTMIFRPEDQWDKGKSFYFQMVLKEKDSDFIDNRYSYFCTVKMMGEELKVSE